MPKNWMKIVVLLLVVPFFLYGATLKEYHPSGFKSNGKKVYGWSWLQKNGDYAEWTFTFPGPQTLKAGTLFFCFTALSTNRKGGGAGYDSSLNIVWHQGMRPVKVDLKNDCGCLEQFASSVPNSRGMGYMSHGCIKMRVKASQIGHGRNRRWGLILKVKYPGGHHTALKKDSVKMYIVK